MLGDYYYNQSIKKTVTVFGSLFNNIMIERLGAETSKFRVPLSFAPKKKFLERLKTQPDLEAQKVAIKLPRMSFEINSFSYDSASLLNPLNKILYRNAGDALGSVKSTRQAVTYSVNFTLNVYTKNMDDMFQIIEQILPVFRPSYTITVKDFLAPGVNGDLPITLSSVSPAVEYEGQLDIRNVIIYTLEFELKIPFFGKPQNEKEILDVNVDFFDIDHIEDSQAFSWIDIYTNENDSQSNYTINTSINDIVVSSVEHTS